jgi:hypothetical protein
MAMSVIARYRTIRFDARKPDRQVAALAGAGTTLDQHHHEREHPQTALEDQRSRQPSLGFGGGDPVPYSDGSSL